MNSGISLPTVLYHVVEPPQTVRTSRELHDLLARGWQDHPVGGSVLDMIAAKIHWYEAEIEVLKANRLSLVAGAEAPAAEDPPQKRGPGRPRKDEPR